MEMRGLIKIFRVLLVCIFLTFCGTGGYSQPPVKLYTVKNGKMIIRLDKEMRESALDSFIIQFDLGNLALKQFIRSGFRDSLKKFGWEIESVTSADVLISKPLLSFDKLNNPAERIIFAENDLIAERFPAISGGVIYGYNRPRNKRPFAVVDSNVTFFMRGNVNANNVMLAGSFNNWRPDALAMKRTDSGWIATVKLGKGKYWYKFIVDGTWRVDDDNALRENDGLGNMNSVYFKTNVVFQLRNFQNARKVYLAGSFNNWKPKELEMVKTADGWELPMYLADGTHTYRFIVDGKWMIDPDNEDKVPNEFNETNSVLRIGIPVLFTINGNLQLPEVFLAGSFNNWRRFELPMKKTASGWELPYNLGAGNYEYRFASKGQWITDPQPPLIIKPNYTFRLKGFPDAKNVYLAGDFNNWSPKGYKMTREGDEWIFTVHLSEGKHQYKFVVDNNWIRDPGNPLWEQNDNGNSIVWFGR